MGWNQALGELFFFGEGSPRPGILPPQFLHSCHAMPCILAGAFFYRFMPRLAHGTILGSTLLPLFFFAFSLPSFISFFPFS